MIFGMNVVVLAIAGWLSYFGITVTEAAVIITGVNQPEATLAPQRAIVEFTNFTVRPGGQEVILSEIVVERTGLGSVEAIDEIMLIAKKHLGDDLQIYSQDEDRVIATGVLDSEGKVRLKNLPDNGGFGSFSNNAKFTIAAVMKSNLSAYAGQVIYLTVKRLKITDLDSKRLKVKGKLPITGAGHTVNSSLNIGSVIINSEYKIGHPYAQFNITAGPVEPILLEKIFIRLTGDYFENTSLYLSVSGQNYQFRQDGEWLYLQFKELLEIPAGSAIAAELQTDAKSGLPEISIRPEDIIVKGKNYNYKIFPELNMEYIGEPKG